MLAVIDKRMPKSMQFSLRVLGFLPIPLPAFSRLSPPVASHPDMLMFPLENLLFVHKDYYHEASSTIDNIIALSKHTLVLVDTQPSYDYPNDVSLNLLCIGKRIFGKAEMIPKELCEYASEHGYRIIDTKQGYAKCSAVAVGDNGIITADPSIQAVAAQADVEVLPIAEGSVSLPPYPYGFLGGGTGFWNDTVYFCGSLSHHPEAKRILAFCEKHKCRTISLSNEHLADMGSILFL